jgi:tRNA A37 threonylcarbamoyladenosine synthetase subunit TsaC/SUA5/YrdC
MQAMDAVGAFVALVLDAGPSVGTVASTVVAVESGSVRILREGAIPAAEILS